MKRIHYCRKIIKRIERKLGIGLDIIDIKVSTPRPFIQVAQLEYTEEGNILYLPPKISIGRSLEEMIIHELGHAYLNLYSIPKRINNLFGNISNWVNPISYIYHSVFTHCFERSDGYVSQYAITCPEEDFCETFSAVMLNRKDSNKITYNGEKIDLCEDKVLSRKVEALRGYLL